MNTNDIAVKHATLHAQRTFLAPGEQFQDLCVQMEECIFEAQETLDGSTLARELHAAEKDRDSWMAAYLARGDELRAMTQARDDATAAHIITAERLQRVEDELKVAKELLGVPLE